MNVEMWIDKDNFTVCDLQKMEKGWFILRIVGNDGTITVHLAVADLITLREKITEQLKK